jgi:hypothetical protein
LQAFYTEAISISEQNVEIAKRAIDAFNGCGRPREHSHVPGLRAHGRELKWRNGAP